MSAHTCIQIPQTYGVPAVFTRWVCESGNMGMCARTRKATTICVLVILCQLHPLYVSLRLQTKNAVVTNVFIDVYVIIVHVCFILTKFVYNFFYCSTVGTSFFKKKLGAYPTSVLIKMKHMGSLFHYSAKFQRLLQFKHQKG
jgi:hypothetical protein